jgi:hypothetical protein
MSNVFDSAVSLDGFLDKDNSGRKGPRERLENC